MTDCGNGPNRKAQSIFGISNSSRTSAETISAWRKCPESSRHQLANGEILLFAAADDFGNLVVLRFDQNWRFRDEHTLRNDAFFPLGSVAFGGYWLVADYDLSQKGPGLIWPAGDPPNRNVHVSAFDASWNQVQDEKITDFPHAPKTEDRTESENCWTELLGSHLYVAYRRGEISASKGPEQAKRVEGSGVQCRPVSGQDPAGSLAEAALVRISDRGQGSRPHAYASFLSADLEISDPEVMASDNRYS